MQKIVAKFMQILGVLFPWVVLIGIIDYRFHNYYWPNLPIVSDLTVRAYFDYPTVLTLYSLIFLLFFVVGLFFSPKLRQTMWLFVKRIWVLGLTMGLAFITAYISYEPVEPLLHSWPYRLGQIWLLPLLLAIVLMVVYRSYPAVKKYFKWSVLLAGSLFGLMIIGESFTDFLPGENRDFLNRTVWPYIDPFVEMKAENANWLAYLFGPLTIWCVGLWRLGNVNRWFSLVVGLISLTVLVLTKSYTGLAVALLLSGLLIWYNLGKKMRASLALAILLIGGLFVATQYQTDKFQILIGNGGQSNSLERRGAIYEVTNELLRVKPITGLGLANYQNLFRQQQQDYLEPERLLSEAEVPPHPHNLLLYFWVELGLFAALALLGLYVYSAIKLTWPGLSFNVRLAFAVLAYPLLHGLLDVPYSLEENSYLFWALVMAAFSAVVDRG